MVLTAADSGTDWCKQWRVVAVVDADGVFGHLSTPSLLEAEMCHRLPPFRPQDVAGKISLAV
jgi:hypothetical protein